MWLIGNYLSPYVRRVAVSMYHLGLDFELDRVMIFQDPDKVRPHNPLARIPALILEDGTVLVESHAILDELDQMVGPERALIPHGGKARRDIMQLTALANACAEKAQWAFYETRFRPADIVHQPWIDHNERQVMDGFGHLEGLAEAAGKTGWLGASDRLTQADITAAVSFTFANTVRPNLNLPDHTPHLAGFTARLEALDCFAKAPLPQPVS